MKTKKIDSITLNLKKSLKKNSFSGGHEIYNFDRSFLGHHYYIFHLSDLCLGEEENIFKEIMQFHI